MFPRIVFTSLLLMILAGLGYGVFRLVVGRQPLPQATAMIERHDPHAAQLILRPLVKTDPRNAEAHVLLARAQLDLNDAVAAEKELKIARALRYERSIINPLLARSYFMQERYQDVVADVPANATRAEERLTNLSLRATAYALMGDVPQAQASLDAAAEISAFDPAVSLARAYVESARSDLTAALTAVNASLDTAPKDLDALMLKANIQLRMDEPAQAMDTVTAAIDLDPNSVPARVFRAHLYIAMNDDKKARADVDAAITVDWHDVPLSLANALLMMRSGRIGDATNFLQSRLPALVSNPKVYYYLALAFSMQDQNESSYDMLTRFQKIAPKDRDGLRLQGLLEQRLGRPAASVDVLQRLVQTAPKDALAFDLLGRAHFMQGHTQDAVDAYRQATILEPNNKDFAAHLAAAQVSFGDLSAPPPGSRASAAPPPGPPPP